MNVNGGFPFSGGMSVSGGTTTFNNPPSTAVNVTNWTISGGDLEMNRPFNASSGGISNGTLGGSGAVTISGSGSTFNWSGGCMGGSGTTTLSAGTTSTLSNTSYFGYTCATSTPALRSLVNNGTFTWSGGYLYGYSGSTFTNNGTFTASISSGDLSFSDQSGGAADPVFVNNNVVNKTGAGRAVMDWDYNDPPSVLNVQAGFLRLQGGGTLTGTVNVSAGATLEFYGSYHLDTASTVQGVGDVTFNSGTVTEDGTYNPSGNTTVNGGLAIFNQSFSIPTFVLNGGEADFNDTVLPPLEGLRTVYRKTIAIDKLEAAIRTQFARFRYLGTRPRTMGCSPVARRFYWMRP